MVRRIQTLTTWITPTSLGVSSASLLGGGSCFDTPPRGWAKQTNSNQHKRFSVPSHPPWSFSRSKWTPVSLKPVIFIGRDSRPFWPLLSRHLLIPIEIWLPLPIVPWNCFPFQTMLRRTHHPPPSQFGLWRGWNLCKEKPQRPLVRGLPTLPQDYPQLEPRRQGQRYLRLRRRRRLVSGLRRRVGRKINWELFLITSMIEVCVVRPIRISPSH